MVLPTEKECLQLFQEFHTPQNVVEHCEMVRKVAVFLAGKLLENGIEIDVEAVSLAALVHDVFRVVDFKKFEPEKMMGFEVTEKDIEIWKHLREKYKGMHHADVIALILEERGYDDFAELVKKHRMKAIMGGKLKLRTWEEKIVYYADKRVSRRKIVTFDQRVQDAIEKHNWSEEDLKEKSKAWEKVKKLEKEIATIIGPENLKLEL